MLILKQQVNSSSNFASFFIVMTHSSSVNFKLIYIFSTLGKRILSKSQIPHAIFQTTRQFFFKFCVTLQWYERYLLCTFLGQIKCFPQKEPIKVEILRISSGKMKLHQILVIFETNQFLFEFCITLLCHEA